MSKLKILVVEDDRDFSAAFSDALKVAGHQVSEVYTGEDAVDMLACDRFDVTFMDVRLPGVNGVACFMKVRETDPKAKVIVMTGYCVQELLDQAIENGAWCVLRKPLDMKRVVNILNKIDPQAA